jgi:head-tail adaptor
MSFDSLLNETATIQRLDDAKDRYGNITKTYETHASNVRVRVDESSPSELDQDTNSAQLRARIYTRYYDIKHTDRISVGGDTWEVVGPPVERQTAALSHHYEIEAKKVTV